MIPLANLLLCSAKVLADVRQGHSLSSALPKHSDKDNRPGVQAIIFHTLRVLGQASAIIELMVPKKIPCAQAHALLTVGIGLMLDSESTGVSYEAHTLVNQTVSAASLHKKITPYKGLINGVLRSFLRERLDILLKLATNPTAAWNFPNWWIDSIRSAYPNQWEAILRASHKPAPLYLRVNQRKISDQALIDLLAQANIKALRVEDKERHFQSQALQLEQARPLEQIPGFKEGFWSVQDRAAQLAAPLLDLQDNLRVLDACAAPGGKSAHLLELADIHLTAVDIDQERLLKIKDTLERLELDCKKVAIKKADITELNTWWDGEPFDRILADVPCSASGIVRRHPDIPWLRRPEDIPHLAQHQKNILDSLWRTLKPGGKLLYATCSIFPAEGEQQAQSFMDRHKNIIRLPAPGQLLPLPPEAPDVLGLNLAEQDCEQHDLKHNLKHNLKYPLKHYLPAASDGFFYALFCKTH